MSDRVVWKYELTPLEINEVRVPSGSRIVAVDRGTWKDEEGPAVWIERDKEADATVEIRLEVIGTGHRVPVGGLHVGSAWCGIYMWHVYDVTEV